MVTGNTFIELATFAQNFCIINVQNTDDRCFVYLVLSAIYPVDRNNNPNHPRHYNNKFKWRGLDQIQFPVDIEDITEIGKKLEVSCTIISFYDDEGRARYPRHISKKNFPIQIDLLYWNGQMLG